jgi:hypothetical protein
VFIEWLKRFGFEDKAPGEMNMITGAELRSVEAHPPGWPYYLYWFIKSLLCL